MPIVTQPVTGAGTGFIVEGTYDGQTGARTLKRHWHSPAWWNGYLVSVRNEPEHPPCETHELKPIDHYGHPTNELWCFECLGVATNPEPRPCTWADCWCHKNLED